MLPVLFSRTNFVNLKFCDGKLKVDHGRILAVDNPLRFNAISILLVAELRFDGAAVEDILSKRYFDQPKLHQTVEDILSTYCFDHPKLHQQRWKTFCRSATSINLNCTRRWKTFCRSAVLINLNCTKPAFRGHTPFSHRLTMLPRSSGVLNPTIRPSLFLFLVPKADGTPALTRSALRGQHLLKCALWRDSLSPFEQTSISS